MRKLQSPEARRRLKKLERDRQRRARHDEKMGKVVGDFVEEEIGPILDGIQSDILLYGQSFISNPPTYYEFKFDDEGNPFGSVVVTEEEVEEAGSLVAKRQQDREREENIRQFTETWRGRRGESWRHSQQLSL
jgi:hypothetical protein